MCVLCMPSHRGWVTIAIATLNEMSRRKILQYYELLYFIIYNQLWIKQALTCNALLNQHSTYTLHYKMNAQRTKMLLTY